MNDPRNRERLRRALEAIELVSADCQSALNARASATLQQNPGPIGIGRIIALARQADTLERCARELYDILDQPPRGNPTVTITEAA
jgi:hypothetical protein